MRDLDNHVFSPHFLPQVANFLRRNIRDICGILQWKVGRKDDRDLDNHFLPQVANFLHGYIRDIRDILHWKVRKRDGVIRTSGESEMPPATNYCFQSGGLP